MPCQNVGIISCRGGDFLPLLDLRERAEKIPVGGSLFEAFGIGSVLHAGFETFHQVVTAAFEKHSRIASGFLVAFLGGESRDTRTVAPANVILEAGPRMRSRQDHRAGG